MPSDSLKILHEDDAVLVAFKPAGLATQAPREFDSLEQHVRAMLARRAAAKNTEGPVYLGLPHRLDRAVSGVIVLAKTRRAARKLSRQFERREVRKIYWACVAGTVDPADGTWTDFMRKIPDQPQAEIVAAEHPYAQQAVLRYRTLDRVSSTAVAIVDAPAASEGTCLEIELETGRMHQIRLQAAARGHAVWGDSLYGSQIPFGPSTDDPRQRIIAVHARSLGFMHPDRGEPLTVTAPLPEEWLRLGLPAEWSEA